MGSSAWADKTVTFNVTEFATTTGTHEVTLDGVTLKARTYNMEYPGYEVFNIYPQAGYEAEVTSETNILKIECTKSTNSWYISNATDFELTTGTHTYTGGLFTWTPTEDTKSVKFAPTDYRDLYTEAIVVTVASEQGGGGGGGNNNSDVTIQFADAHTAAGGWFLEAPYTENGVTVSAGKDNLGYYPEFTGAGRVIIVGNQEFTVAAPEGKKISKVVLNAEFTENELSNHPSWTLDRTYTLSSGTVESKDVQTATFKDINAATFTFSPSDRVYVMNMVVTLGEGGEEGVPADGVNYYVYREDDGKKYYLVPDGAGKLTLELYDDTKALTHYQWTAEAKSGEGKAYDAETRQTSDQTFDGFALKNVESGVYVGHYEYDDQTYRCSANTASEGDILVFTESTDEYSKGLYSLYNAQGGLEREENKWNFEEEKMEEWMAYQGYLTMSYNSYYNRVEYNVTSSATDYVWNIVATTAMSPADKDVYLVSLDTNNKPNAFVVENEEGALAEDEEFDASYGSKPNFSLVAAEGGYYVKSLESQSFVTPEGLAAEGVVYSYSEGKLYNGSTTPAYYAFEYGAEELSNYNSNSGYAATNLQDKLTAAKAVDQTKYPAAMMANLNAAIDAAEAANKFLDNYSELASELEKQLGYVADYKEGTFQVEPAAGFQGYIMNSKLGKAIGIVNGNVIVADLDKDNDKNFVWTFEEKGEGLAFRNLGVNKYLSYVHYINCAGYEHEDFNIDNAALYPELVDADDAHVFGFVADEYNYHGGGYLIKDFDPCTVPAAYKGYDYESPYLYAYEDFDGEDRLFADESEWGYNSSSTCGWKFYQLETPYVDAPYVVTEEVVYEPATIITLTFSREVKVANATGAVLMHKVNGEQEGVEINLSQATGKNPNFKEVIISVTNLEGVATGAYDVVIAEGSIVDRANNEVKVAEYAVTIDVQGAGEPDTFVPVSYSPSEETPVAELDQIVLTFNEWPTLVEDVVTLAGGHKLTYDNNDGYNIIFVLKEAITTSGSYTFTIPAGKIYNGLFDADAEDFGVSAGAIYNPELTLSVTVENTTGVANINVQMNGKSYNVAGQRISKDAKGVIVVDGKKLLRK